MFNKTKIKPTAEIPTSSMADIAFLLIVFFMLTTVFAADRGVNHKNPPQQIADTPEEAMYLQIKPGHLLYH